MVAVREYGHHSPVLYLYLSHIEEEPVHQLLLRHHLVPLAHQKHLSCLVDPEPLSQVALKHIPSLLPAEPLGKVASNEHLLSL